MSTDDYLAKIEELYERILQLSETIHQKDDTIAALRRQLQDALDAQQQGH